MQLSTVECVVLTFCVFNSLKIEQLLRSILNGFGTIGYNSTHIPNKTMSVNEQIRICMK